MTVIPRNTHNRIKKHTSLHTKPNENDNRFSDPVNFWPAFFINVFSYTSTNCRFKADFKSFEVLLNIKWNYNKKCIRPTDVIER